MANLRKDMNDIKQVLRLHFELQMPIKVIARTLKMSKNTIKAYLKRFNESEQTLEEALIKEPLELEKAFTQEHKSARERYAEFVLNADRYLMELNKHKHLTRYVLWEEEFKSNRIAYKYSQFCFHLQQYERSTEVRMVQHHVPGEKWMVDFAGDRLKLTDPDSGKLTPVEILVMTLAYSNKTIVVAVPSQKIGDFIAGLTKGLQLLGGCPKVMVSDNLKSAVTKSNLYEPVLNTQLLEWANYYGITVLPARARKPRDKAKVEGSVNIAYQSIYSRLRKEVFHSIEALNQALQEQCELLNEREMKAYGESRNSLFNRDEKPVMPPVSLEPYPNFQRYRFTVSSNGHIYIGKKKQHYSVPHRFTGQKVDVVMSDKLVKIYHQGECVATHTITGARYHTQADHMPSSHRAYLEGLNPEKLLERASKMGHEILQTIQLVLNRGSYPEQNYKTCNGILALANSYGHQRLQACCHHAMSVEKVSYTYIASLCKNKHFDPSATHKPEEASKTGHHINTRGPEAFNKPVNPTQYELFTNP